MKRTLTPSQNLGYKEVTEVTTDRYDRAVRRERNKRRRIVAEVCETMTATARTTQTVLTGIEVYRQLSQFYQRSGGAATEMCTVRAG